MFPSVTPNDWIICPQPNRQASLRLFCFPYAGGGASVYRTWSNELYELEVCSIQLPGREGRLKETPFKQMMPLVQILAVALQPYLDKPFAFWGHSVGALISFELAREFRRRRYPQPSYLLVGGHCAPHLPAPRPPIHQLPKALFVEELQRYNGTPDAVLKSEELMQLLLPLLRADFAVNETYNYVAEEPLNCPITAFGGQEDTDVSRQELDAWSQQTRSSFRVHMLPGNHFFLNSCRTHLLQLILQELNLFFAAAKY